MRISVFTRMRLRFSRIKRRFSSAIERNELDVAVRFIVEVRRIFVVPIFALRIFGLRAIVEVRRILELFIAEPLVAVCDMGFIAMPLEPILVEPILVEPILGVIVVFDIVLV